MHLSTTFLRKERRFPCHLKETVLSPKTNGDNLSDMKQIRWSEEDNAYIVSGEYSGLSAFGKTMCEALKEYEIAKKAYLEVEAEDAI